MHRRLAYNDIVIDITRDQFKRHKILGKWSSAIYIGERDGFCDLFEVRNHDTEYYNENIKLSDKEVK